jgi:hypothetical protein
MKQMKPMQDLKLIAIRTTFNTLPISRKRELVFDLLNDAEEINEVESSSIDPRFRTWLSQNPDGYNHANEQETERLWHMWNFVKNYAESGITTDNDTFRVYPHDRAFSGSWDGNSHRFSIHGVPWGMSPKPACTRDQFFDHILTNSNPSKFLVQGRNADFHDGSCILNHSIVDPILDMGMLEWAKWNQFSYTEDDAEQTKYEFDRASEEYAKTGIKRR